MKLYLADQSLVNVSNATETYTLRDGQAIIQLAFDVTDEKSVIELANLFTTENIADMRLELANADMITYHKSAINDIRVQVSDQHEVIQRLVRLE